MKPPKEITVEFGRVDDHHVEVHVRVGVLWLIAHGFRPIVCGDRIEWTYERGAE